MIALVVIFNGVKLRVINIYMIIKALIVKLKQMQDTRYIDIEKR